MSVTVKLEPTSVIKARLGIDKNGKAHKYFTKRVADYMDKYVPFESGVLRNTATIETDSVTYVQEYANYQYKGISKSGKALNYKTAGSGSYWDKKMMAVQGDEVIAEVQSYIDRGCK